MYTTGVPTGTMNWHGAVMANDYTTILSYLRQVAYKFCGRSADAVNNRDDLADDLAQELFLKLWEKDRFSVYKDMTNQEIASQIKNIELANIRNFKLRKDNPEEYRIALRITNILKTDQKFRHYSKPGHERLRDQIYGLSEWDPDKYTERCLVESLLKDKISVVAPRPRNYTRIGCVASEMVISNPALKSLIYEILDVIGCPTSVGVIRKLCFSKLYTTNFYSISVDSIFASTESKSEDFFEYHIALVSSSDQFDEPLSKYEQIQVEMKVEVLLSKQFKCKLNRANQDRNFLKVIWFLYFDPSRLTQVQIAEQVGKGNSLISMYQRNFESGLQEFNFSKPEQSHCMQYLLRRTLTAFSVE